MPIYLYNSLHHRIEEFKPLKKNKVGLYTCGPTVYNFAHIGNLRTYIFEDFLKRILRYNGYKLKHVMNITDVGHLTDDGNSGEDKMEKGSLREGKTAWEIAEFYTREFRQDLERLNIIAPDIWCRATDHIKEQIKLIKKLQKGGFAYATSDGIYFDTSKLPDYGKLANLQNQDLRGGARVEVGDKKNITDFALWKFSPKLQKRQMEWDSPWGVGFPGWHIECSAMATKYLGQPFDIHCGGIDHVPVHHTNEIAQSEAAYDTPLANYWLHGEFLIIAGDKMAKSGENFLTLQVLQDKGFSPLAYRYLLMQTNYRKQLNFSWEALTAAQTGLQNFYKELYRLKENLPHFDKKNSAHTAAKKKIEEEFSKKINDDLDLPGALALLHTAIKTSGAIDFETVLKFDKVLGLKIEENTNIKIEKEESIKAETLPDHIQRIIIMRDAVRAQKDWIKSDQLRKQLESMGYKVEDTKEGTKVSK